MTSSAIPPGFHPIRHDRLLQERIHDAYQARAKPPEPTICPQCHAVFHNGRWDWRKLPEQAHSALCPACRRIAENDAAGNVVLSGGFVQAHREELLNLVRHTEEKERQEHALERLIGISEEDGRILIGTTGSHLANRIGHALEAAYDGTVHYTYTENETHLDVSWTRE